MRRCATNRVASTHQYARLMQAWYEQLCGNPQLRCSSTLGPAVNRQRQDASEEGASQQNAQGSQDQQLEPQMQAPRPRRAPEPNLHFFNHPIAAQRAFKPVRWVRAGEVDAAQSRKPAQQVNGQNSRMPQPEEEEDPWALGEAKSSRQTPPAARQRLSWSQPPVYQRAQPFLQRPAQPANNRAQAQPRRPTPQQDNKQAAAKQQAVQGQSKDWWKQFQAPGEQDLRQATGATYHQFLRNQAQMQRQAAEHEEKKRRQAAAEQPQQATQPAYADLTAAPKRKAAPTPQPAPEAPTEIEIPPDVTVRQLANLLGHESTQELEKVLADVGDPPSSIEERLPIDTAELAVMEFGRVAVISKAAQEVDADAQPRPAVVTVMGHVDHGKTSLLDALRKTSVAAGEAGGITQHIGAFEVKMPDSQQSLTFLDTPGHAAFSAMRARGAAITDLVVLVAAADDGVMPQTREALAHCKAAGCPIVVALTKCDVPMADPGRVRQQLIAEGLELEEVGGDVQVVHTAAPKGQGLLQLEEALMLQAEGLDLKASPSRPAEAVVVEAKLDKGQGPVATAIVKRGSLAVGQYVVVGNQWGKLRSLRTAAGISLKTALPGQPVEIAGLKGVPQAGDQLQVLPTEERAKRVSDARSQRADRYRQDKEKHAVMLQLQQQQLRAEEEAAAAAAEGNEEQAEGRPANLDPAEDHNLTLIIKADVQGSAEAVREAVTALGDSEVGVKVVAEGVGPVTSADVDTARAAGASIVAFNVKFANAAVEGTAKVQAVQVVQHRIIYRLLEEVNDMIAARAPLVEQEKVVGQADVLQVFDFKSKDAAAVAGCRVSDGSVQSALQWRVMRGGSQVYTGPCNSIKRHKQQVHQVGKGTECGITLKDFGDFRLGDILQCIAIEKVPSKLKAKAAAA